MKSINKKGKNVMKYPLSANKMNEISNKPTPNTKGELMSNTYSKDELRNIDVTLPIEISNSLIKKNEDTFFYVMNYNENIFGKVEDMRKK
tara:strand:- start:425 stop:694 length:270 start_codon:yes stop_codon:yes gene_type:complete